MIIKDLSNIDIVLHKNTDEYKSLHENQQKRHNAMKYDSARETKHILPPNLRHKLEPYNWPKSICPDTIKTINDHEQAIWKETLERIANIRHQTIVWCRRSFRSVFKLSLCLRTLHTIPVKQVLLEDLALQWPFPTSSMFASSIGTGKLQLNLYLTF
jgi:hypothetical protein